LNGDRTLSNTRLSCLTISRTPNDDLYPSPPATPSTATVTSALEAFDGERVHNYEWLLCAAHFVGDGMALHATGNEFFALLGGSMSDEELRELAALEWTKRWETPIPDGVRPALILSYRD